MIRNIIYIIGSMLFFFAGIVVYGIILNLREKSLDESLIEKNITKLGTISILVDRRNYKLDLFSDSIKVKSYHVVFGRNANSFKKIKNDFITPTGEYKICRIDSNNVYYKKMFLNYPNVSDASEALRNKVINLNEFLSISESLSKSGVPYEKSALGADIGIHGIGEYNIIFKNLPFVFNWTNGSIALSNENVDELLSIISIGTNVTIKNN